MHQKESNNTIHEYYPIQTQESPTGNLDDYWLKKVITRNREPKFNSEDKYYDLVKILKSNTLVVPWLIKIDGGYYVALYNFMDKINYCVTFFKSDSKGNYDILNPICIYLSYVDLESACDRFANEYIAMKINQGDERYLSAINSIECVDHLSKNK